jgi:hypothetical protein
MPLSNDGKNSALAGLTGGVPTNVITHLSLHSADPGAGGANEVSGGGYARIPVNAADWDIEAAIEGAELNNDKQFVTPALQPIHSVGMWTALSGGTYLGGDTATGDTAANGSGEFIVKAGSILRLLDS